MPNDYDVFAEAYDRDLAGNAWNAHYERPALIAMAGDVAELEVLDAGCGGGWHSLALQQAGARITGFDSSRGMLEVARQRLGADATLLKADLASDLPFASEAFDSVVSALALHYVEDWSQPLGEFFRVLRPGGRLVFSTHHPFMDHPASGHPNYFETYSFSEVWEKGGHSAQMQFWHRPLGAMVAAITEAGFAIERIEEPQPLPEAERLFPAAFRTLSTAPRFLFFAARKPR
ncbi:methyltransferase [Devosia pacifica]|uniref:Methyltransferase n=1 Tax=Devosia pacifica TaxID=1335967 RepID=A0A918S5P3_9HYPH|nr:class I SAM-dependent methyltransferase [Devosia pacifica]GHA25904.1 methyltransferase [Devosia pacifica]